MRHLGLKSLSILIAILLSIYVNSENNITSARIPISVDVREMPENRVLVWQLKKQIDVEVRGPSFLVNRLVLSPPTLRLKIPESSDSKFTAQVTKNDLDIHPPVQVLSIEPSTISFTIEEKVSKELKVKVPLIGQLRQDLQLASITVTPEVISLVGPASELKDLSSVQTIPIDLREIKESYTDQLPLRFPGKLTESLQPQVTVRISVAEVDAKKVFEEVPIEIRQGADDLILVQPQAVTVTVLGTQAKISEVKEFEVIPFIRVPKTLDPKGSHIAVQVDVPQGMRVVTISPERVLVTSRTVGKALSTSEKRK